MYAAAATAVTMVAGVLISAACFGAAPLLPDFAELVKRSAPAVVNISTSQKRQRPQDEEPGGVEPPKLPESSPFNEYFRRYFERKEAEEFDTQSLGSGFIISADGYIISNNHVVKDADQVVVRLNDRREFVAKVVGADERSDIALLKIDAQALPVAIMGRSNELSVGEWVLAIGSPFGLEHSVTVGIVSYKGRPLPQANYVPYIQTDVAINPGNSGGPLFNQAGEVVGVNSQIFSRTGGYMGMSFAIPIDVAMNVAEQLRSKGRVSRGWLGVLIHDVTGEMAESYGLTRPEGALIARVLEDSPAAKGGLETGDVVLTYNGHPVLRSSDLPPIVGASPVGASAPVTLIRKVGDSYERLQLEVTTGELPEDVAQAAAPKDAPGAGTGKLGAEVVDLTDDERGALGVETGWGVRVRSLTDGPLVAAGVLKGDVILSINHIEVRGKGHFAEVAEEVPRGRPVALYLMRGKKPVFLALSIAER